MHQNQLEDLLEYSFLGLNPEFWVSWSGFLLSRSVRFGSSALWTAACQTLSVGFLWQEHWSGLPLPPPGDLPYPAIKPASPLSPAFRVASLPTKPFRNSGLGLQHLRIHAFNKFSGRHWCCWSGGHALRTTVKSYIKSYPKRKFCNEKSSSSKYTLIMWLSPYQRGWSLIFINIK